MSKQFYVSVHSKFAKDTTRYVCSIHFPTPQFGLHNVTCQDAFYSLRPPLPRSGYGEPGPVFTNQQRPWRKHLPSNSAGDVRDYRCNAETDVNAMFYARYLRSHRVNRADTIPLTTHTVKSGRLGHRFAHWMYLWDDRSRSEVNVTPTHAQ